MLDPSRADLAQWFGYTSIGFWLFAQAPQVFKNIHLQSCEGLALPFLCNWLFGDITNLVGCVLTDQLPFQTYLAAYFCMVDLTLVVQYIYYRPRKPLPVYRSPSHRVVLASPHQSLLIQTAPMAHANSHSLTRSTSTAMHHSVHQERYPQTAHPHPGAHSRAATNPNPPLSASSSSTVRPRTAAPLRGIGPSTSSASMSSTRTGGAGDAAAALGGTAHEVQVMVTSPRDMDGSYQAIYEAALDVARAAERAQSRRRSLSQQRRFHRPSAGSSSATALPRLAEGGGGGQTPRAGSSSRPRVRRAATTQHVSEEEEDDQVNPAMMESFHSDLSALTDTSSAAGDGSGNRDIMSMSTPALLTARGRSLQRTGTGMALNVPTPPSEEALDQIEGLPAGAGLVYAQPPLAQAREGRSKSRSVSMARNASSRGRGRRAAGVAFMSLGLLAGWNGVGRGPRIRSGTARGVVLSPPAPTGLALPVGAGRHYYPPIWVSPLQSSLHPASAFIYVDHPPHEPPERPEAPDLKRLIGRISAWSCTTLYLTSRLPQIWKNFERKSVEGLSILLFLFAFCGNTFYVFSIVLNPAASQGSPEANHYLLEALPYLLGSGGTLLFDLTIMLQSLLYGSSPPVPPTAIERSSFRRPLFRRRIRYVEDGRVSGSFTAGGGEHSERQPLLSQSVTLPRTGQGMFGSMHEEGRRDARERERERTRSASSDVVMRAGGWKRAASQGRAEEGLGLERVVEPAEPGEAQGSGGTR